MKTLKRAEVAFHHLCTDWHYFQTVMAADVTVFFWFLARVGDRWMLWRADSRLRGVLGVYTAEVETLSSA